MARFYFHFWTGDHYEVDHVGLDYPDLPAAYLGAFTAAKEIAADMILERQDPTGLRFDIVDSEGRSLMDLPFSELFKSAPKRPFGRQPKPPRQGLSNEVAAAIASAREAIGRSRAIMARSRAQTLSGFFESAAAGNTGKAKP